MNRGHLRPVLALVALLACAVALEASYTIVVHQPVETRRGIRFERVNITNQEEAGRYLDALRRSGDPLPPEARAVELLFPPAGVSTDFRDRIVAMNALSEGNSVTIHLVDDTYPAGTRRAFRDEFDRRYEGIWPHASREGRRRSLWIGTKYLATHDSPSGSEIRGVIAHEFAHTQDEYHFHEGEYGPTGGHRADYVLRTPNAAWLEGFADYFEMRESPDTRERLEASVGDLRRQRGMSDREIAEFESIMAGLGMTLDRGEIDRLRRPPVGEPDFGDFIRNEAFIALLLRQIAELPGGEEAMLAAYRRVRRGGSSLQEFLRQYARDNPGNIPRIAEILIDLSNGAASPDDIARLMGDAARTYAATLRGVAGVSVHSQGLRRRAREQYEVRFSLRAPRSTRDRATLDPAGPVAARFRAYDTSNASSLASQARRAGTHRIQEALGPLRATSQETSIEVRSQQFYSLSINMTGAGDAARARVGISGTGADTTTIELPEEVISGSPGGAGSGPGVASGGGGETGESSGAAAGVVDERSTDPFRQRVGSAEGPARAASGARPATAGGSPIEASTGPAASPGSPEHPVESPAPPEASPAAPVPADAGEARRGTEFEAR